ncbi:MAG: cyclic nucleotide-binding domain-containing protein [Burkholderiaceae bacterium]|nr:MAG: cyclic nucleotide-binding domain-containing protein [Burkholderiaceae bacterium]
MDVGVLVFGVAVLLALVSFMPAAAGRLNLPYSVLLAVVGIALGVVIRVHGWAPQFLSGVFDSLQHFEVSSETIIYVFLPILLFETSLSTNVRRLLDDIGPILMMAIVAVVACTVAVGFSISAVSNYGLAVCLMLGAIVATTDPAAVVSLFREVGAPKRLTTLVEGESLFNDAASIALYSILLTMLRGGAPDVSIGAIFSSFLYSFLGGGLAGFLLGRLACWLFVSLRGWPMSEVTLTIAVAYLTFFLTDHYLGASGVVATVVAGLVVGSSGRTRMSPTAFDQTQNAWTQFGFWANSLIFLFAAMLIPRMMRDVTWDQIWLVLLVFLVTLAMRAVIVFGVLPLLGRTGLSAKVSGAYRTAMWWGGLRGAVSLALALAVTEQSHIPYEARQFIAVATTSFVVMTLFINGISLRPLIRRLRLDQLSPVERTIRNQALMVAVEGLQDKTAEIAENESIGADAQGSICSVFDATLASVNDGQVRQLTQDEKVAVGLAIVAAREEEMFFEMLKSQIVEWRIAENVLARAERMSDAIRAGGLAGFEAAIEDDLRYSIAFRMALRLYHVANFDGWLALEIAKRFMSLRTKRSEARHLITFARKELPPMLGGEATEIIVHAHEQRLQRLDSALQAFDLQYPSFASWMQESYLGRMARAMERKRYSDMLSQFLISGEVYSDLLSQIDQRWAYLDKRPAIDIAMSADEMVKRVPLFEDVSPQTLRAIGRLLKPRLAVPGQEISMQVGRTQAMYFVASGAVVVDLPDRTTIELGTGEFFGEVALFKGTKSSARVRSLGYSQLLMLQAREFDSLLERDQALREKIEVVIKQRLRAFEVWQQFESGERQHEPLPDGLYLSAPADESTSEPASATEPASVVESVPVEDPGPEQDSEESRDAQRN